MSTATQTDKFDPIVSFEPITKQQISMIARTIGMIPAMICNLGEADASKGAGVISKTCKCLWTKDGRRITVSYDHGTLVTSCSRAADPDCPKGAAK